MIRNQLRLSLHHHPLVDLDIRRPRPRHHPHHHPLSRVQAIQMQNRAPMQHVVQFHNVIATARI